MPAGIAKFHAGNTTRYNYKTDTVSPEKCPLIVQLSSSLRYNRMLWCGLFDFGVQSQWTECGVEWDAGSS